MRGLPWSQLIYALSMLARAASPLRFVVLVLLSVGCHAPPAASPEPSPAAPPGSATETLLPHETFTLDSRVLGETRRINVYTPPEYASATSTRYPVLYMPDGGVEEDFPHVARTVDTAIRAGEMRPLILVGIENTERRRDMTGPTEVEEDRKIAVHVGGSAGFRAFLRDELMPAIDARVRGNGVTGIVGESLAGLFIVETFLLEPEMFDVYVALSPSLWWNAQSLLRSAGERLRGGADWSATFYFSIAGDDDLGDAGEMLAAALRQDAPERLTWFYEPMLAERHSTIYRAASPIALRRVFPPE